MPSLMEAKGWRTAVTGGLARPTLGSDILRKMPDLDPGLAVMACQEQCNVIRRALHRLPPERSHAGSHRPSQLEQQRDRYHPLS